MEKNKKNEVKTLNGPMLIISIIFLLTSILITKFTVIRLILWIVSLIVLSINIKKTYSYTTSKTIIIYLLLLMASIIVDGVISFSFSKIPVFTYNIVNTKNTIVYNSIGIRAWQCDKKDYKKIIVDPFYKNGYMCDIEDIESIDINTFLNTIVENHNEYKNKYVKITGKISKKSGLNSIEMKAYEKTDNQVNGYVEFSDNITLKILFDKDELSLDTYDIYDEITIIGVIKNIDKATDNHIVYMTGTRTVSNLDLKEYTITINKEKKCSTEPIQIYTSTNYELYKYCLKDVIVTFPDGQYEIEAALSSNKLYIPDLPSGSTKSEKNKEDNTTIYRFDDYSILVCDNKISNKIFIGPKKMKIDAVECQVNEEE